MKDFEVDNMTGTNNDGARANTPLRFLTATSIMADEVYNLQDEKLGGIHDIMIDLHTGKIEYVVVECGGFLGIGEKFFAIPYQAFMVDANKEAFILDQTKETLKDAPGFDKDHWPETNSHYNDASTYWGGFMGSNTGAVPY